METQQTIAEMEAEEVVLVAQSRLLRLRIETAKLQQSSDPQAGSVQERSGNVTQTPPEAFEAVPGQARSRREGDEMPKPVSPTPADPTKLVTVDGFRYHIDDPSYAGKFYLSSEGIWKYVKQDSEFDPEFRRGSHNHGRAYPPPQPAGREQANLEDTWIYLQEPHSPIGVSHRAVSVPERTAEGCTEVLPIRAPSLPRPFCPVEDIWTLDAPHQETKLILERETAQLKRAGCLFPGWDAGQVFAPDASPTPRNTSTIAWEDFSTAEDSMDSLSHFGFHRRIKTPGAVGLGWGGYEDNTRWQKAGRHIKKAAINKNAPPGPSFSTKAKPTIFVTHPNSWEQEIDFDLELIQRNASGKSVLSRKSEPLTLSQRLHGPRVPTKDADDEENDD